jgi:hypothetical protein
VPKNRYVVVACARWETPYIVEWIAYYKAIGFDHIYLYCNDDDPSDFVRAVCANPGHADFVTLRHFVGQGLQSAMYHDAMRTVRAEAEWVTFLDIDEFLVLRGVNDIHAFMLRFDPSVDSVYFNWLMFGNNDFIDRPPGSVLQQYTRRCSTLDPHTKHISRVEKLIPDILALPSFPFWHGLANPLWSSMRRVNVLGNDCGNYLEAFPENANNVLADADVVTDIISVAVVNHYTFKSEKDFVLRAQRGLGGQFGGQVKWLELYRRGDHKKILADFNTTEDTYLRDFAQCHGIAAPPGRDRDEHSTTTHGKRRVTAETAVWRSELELDSSSGRIRHCSHGTEGNYIEFRDFLLINWDKWSAELFKESSGTYKVI